MMRLAREIRQLRPLRINKEMRAVEELETPSSATPSTPDPNMVHLWADRTLPSPTSSQGSPVNNSRMEGPFLHP